MQTLRNKLLVAAGAIAAASAVAFAGLTAASAATTRVFVRTVRSSAK